MTPSEGRLAIGRSAPCKGGRGCPDRSGHRADSRSSPGRPRPPNLPPASSCFRLLAGAAKRSFQRKQPIEASDPQNLPDLSAGVDERKFKTVLAGSSVQPEQHLETA